MLSEVARPELSLSAASPRRSSSPRLLQLSPTSAHHTATMAGGAGLTVRPAYHSGSRWVGRSAVLPSNPSAPQWVRWLVLTAPLFGLQLVWSCEMAQGPSLLPPGSCRDLFTRPPTDSPLLVDPHLPTDTTRAASPFLLSLGVSKSMMSIVFLAGPLSGLIVQPLVGVLSDRCKSTLGRRRPFIVAGCACSSVSVLMLGWSKEIAAVFADDGTTLVRRPRPPCPVPPHPLEVSSS